MQIKLHDLLNYHNENILARYRHDFPNAHLSAEHALTELMKYIWLCHKHQYDKTMQPTNPALQFACVIHAEMQEIDNMWHTFLLFTKEYHAFCHDYLNGHFFHHEPTIKNDNTLSTKDYEQQLKNYLSYIYDNLGEETVSQWFNYRL